MKKEVVASFAEEHRVSSNIQHWKGNEIALFQEDLFAKVKASVSEKWFYTYFKNEAGKLPRIDMLNLLSMYLGHKNWHVFKKSHNSSGTSTNKRVKNIYILLAGVLVLGVFWLFWEKENEFTFCFVDQLTDRAIVQTPLDIKILQEKESPLVLKTDNLGCFRYKTTADHITFIIKSPFYKTDTITRYINTKSNEAIKVASDDYALMLNFYTSGNVKDWKKHRRQLDDLISEQAVIYQLYNASIGVEVYTKEDFIQMLTIPTTSLKKIQILDKRIVDEKIVKLKFMVK
ncbi:hypothetical protein [Flagellimonas onchidii]|uniref:hypothetical protein n=1 Tax=Flagellimonas onchidii TaxID=2562684 RepID=UPI0010A6855B|nr:hypothetical protein [Allomuricauda onchidii]